MVLSAPLCTLPKAKLWMHLNYLVEHCEENGIDKMQTALFFIGSGLAHLVSERGAEETAKYVSEMLDEVRQGKYDPANVANMTPASLLKN